MALHKMGKTPRMDRYQRLLNRFFEPLILQRSLGKAQGAHTPAPKETDTDKSTRRRFAENICSVCDYKKGGDSTPAIGIEERGDCYNFWVASPQTSDRIVKFVQTILKDIQCIATTSDELKPSKETEFVHKCINFCKPRIGKEAAWLRRIIQKCSPYLADLENIKGRNTYQMWCFLVNLR